MAKKRNGIESDDLSPFTKSLVESVLGPRPAREKKTISVALTDPFGAGELSKEQVDAENRRVSGMSPLVKSVMNLLNGPGDTIERLAFDTDPSLNNTYQSLYKVKQRLLPDEVLKRIGIQDDLVAAICNARSNQMSSFGRPQPDRFSTGFRIEPQPGLLEKLSDDEKKKLQDRISSAELKLLSCGETRGWKDTDVLSFGQFMHMSARNAVLFGRIAVEAIYSMGMNGKKQFHSFRPIDAGTIYRAAPQKEAADSVRRQARKLLEQIKNKNLEPERFQDDEYSWVQVISGRPVQAFTAGECLVHNFYPVTDVELDGYPLTPLDTIITAVTTHINIGNHNKLYFQSGRAARGMIVIKSDDADDGVIKHIRQQFQASINSVGNAWRMPIFGVGTDDDIGWYPIDNSSRDMEFQYLSDTNARVILSGFQMSPEELPGYAHLSKGTNNQALSECFTFDSILWTDKGAFSASQLLGPQDEVLIRVWTGTKYTDARLFRTGEKILAETIAGGLKVKTSPDHRFRTLSEEGELQWKRQEELGIGDLLVVNAQPLPGDEALVPVFNGKRLTVEMMEILGWMTGDGCLTPAVDGVRGAMMKLFYHHEKERDVWENHAKTLAGFGFDVKHQERVISDEEAEALKTRYGFKSIAKSRLTNVVYSNSFVQTLSDFGCSFSSKDKTVPPVLHSLPVEYRRSFLRGLFSADGHATTTGAVVLTIQADSTREQVRQLLMGLGIRTLPCKGINRKSFGVKSLEKQLHIKDKNVFWETIGFKQLHKQERRRDQKWSIGSVPTALASRMLGFVTSTPTFSGWSKNERDNIKSITDGSRGISFKKLRSVMELAGVSIPSWMSEYHIESVTDSVVHEIKVPMVDVEVFDSQHAQILQGFQVHNSNNEYKLEAHRDVGIRPLLGQLQNFINARILPLLDEGLSSTCSLKFIGLDVETAEKESIRLQQDMAVHMSMDEVLDKVEKKPVGKEWGGQFLLNPQWQAVLDKYVPQGAIMEHFFGMKGAGKDPRYDFINNPNYFAQMQLLQAEQQAQMAQQPQQGAEGQEGASQPGEGGEGAQDAGAQPQQGGDDAATPDDGPQDLTRSLDQLSGLLSKSEAQMPTSRRRLLAQQRMFVRKALQAFEAESREAIKEIVDIAEKHVPPTKKKG